MIGDGRVARLDDTQGTMLSVMHETTTFERIADEWRELAVVSGRGIFATPEWAEAWWEARRDGRELALSCTRDGDGRLVAVLPLYRRRVAGLVTAQFLGHGPADELGPVFRAEDRASALEAFRDAARSLQCDVFVGAQLPGGEQWSELVTGVLWRREASPVLDLPRSWEDYLASRSANFRQQLRRSTRRVSRLGNTRFRLSSAATLDRDIDALFALHAARWEGRRTDFVDPSFHRDVAWRALRQGWLRLWLLELDGRPVAAWHGFQVGGSATYYQAGRDPSFSRYGLGTVLLAHSIREAIGENASQYRFGRGEESFKYRFCDRDPGLETVVVARTRKGKLALEAARLVRPLNRWRRGLSTRRAP